MSWPETVRKEDMEISFYRGSGPGGQHRYKTDSACRMKHNPTGTVTQSEEHKRQGQNKKAAWERMTDILVPLMRAAASTQVEPSTSSERVRTYHEPDSRVKDHRSGKTYRYKDILEGKLDELLDDLAASKGRVNDTKSEV
jgi:peptide chain release factor 1